MANEDYEPSDAEERLLTLLKDGRDADQPWGRVTPQYAADQLDMKKPNTQVYLGNLQKAGWVRRLARGLYEIKKDPRNNEEKHD